MPKIKKFFNHLKVSSMKILSYPADDRVYTEVKPLIDSKKITIEFILQHIRKC